MGPPIILWGTNLGALAAGLGTTWSPELWSGTVVMTALLGLALLAFPPDDLNRRNGRATATSP